MEPPVDDPNYEIDRTRKNREQLAGEYEKAKRDYDQRYQEYLDEQGKVENILFFNYSPYANKINGLDARGFIILGAVSLLAVAAMLLVLVRDLGRRPPVYSVEEMADLRARGYAPATEQEAKFLVMNLWHNINCGKEPEEGRPVPVDSRGELNILAAETAIAAGSLPTDPEAVDRLNRLSDSICFWRTRYLIAPGISMDSGIVKRIFMAIVYVALLCIYPGHPMYLLVVFSPLAFLTPAYLAESRERSFVYRMLGGSLKMFGSMTGSALAGAGRMEGATATIYRDGWGNAYIEKNYWGVLIVFLLRIAFALFFLYLIFIIAPFIVLYAIIRNYILAK